MMRMTDARQCSVPLMYYLVLFILIPVLISAWPTTTFCRNHHGRRQLASGSITATPPTSAGATQTVETAQVVTMFGGNTTETCILISTPTSLSNGNTAVIVSKNCTYSRTPSPSPSNTLVSVMSPSTSLTTILSSMAPAANNTITLSMFTTAGLAASTLSSVASLTPSTTLTSAAIIPSMSALPLPTSLNISPSSTSAPSSLAVTFASSTSSPDPFTSSAQSHLSSLPIFLGSFGGIAGLALLTVALKVYRPWQNFNGLGLFSPGLFRRLNTWYGTIWRTERRTGDSDSEKLTGGYGQSRERMSIMY